VIKPKYKVKIYFYFSLMGLLGMLWLCQASNPIQAQEIPDNDALTQAVFNQLSPNERVGQLFMVSFQGNEPLNNPQIAQLIQQYRIGGVYISAQHENFSNERNAPLQLLALTNALQELAQTSPAKVDYTATFSSTAKLTVTHFISDSKVYHPTPLFIAADHEGDAYPYTQIRNGLIPIPSQMSIGATWNSEIAHKVGAVVGQELSLLGVNMLLGPSLDVLDNPRPELNGSLGTRTFGGHPYWVAKLGQAYIRGIHEGSNQHLLTIAKHFPGFGSSDREINQNLPIILKSLEDLRRTELLPFFRVTNMAEQEATNITDGLMTAHIRYQGLQGNVPISLDARNLPALLSLKEIAPWREAGGLIVSAPLGSPAVLDSIASNRTSFPARQLVQDALFAGNDVLFLGDFTFKNNPDEELNNITDAIKFLQERYQQDNNFQIIIDKAVLRILKAKIKVYGADLFNIEVKQPAENLIKLSNITLDIDQIAQAGATLITPRVETGNTPLTSPPQPNERILIVTDDSVGQDCATCVTFPLIERTALQDIILELFGPNATGQITPSQISSYSFSDLKNILTEGTPEANSQLEQVIQQSDWIIFAMLDLNPEKNPASDAVRVLLRNRYDALRNKKLVLFAFNAPYFLGETEISQLTAYYAFYSKGTSYLRAAARLLFQQLAPQGTSPVAIPALGPLDLSPDPQQFIQLKAIQKIDSQGKTVELPPDGNRDLKVGESLIFETNVLVDKKDNPVPDGTRVDFFRFYPLEGLSSEPLTAYTIDGVAQMKITKERDTPLRVSASSNLATQSIPFDIGPGFLDTPTPTATTTPMPSPTSSATATTTPTASPSPTVTASPSPTPIATPLPPTPAKPVSGLGLFFTLVGALLVGGIGFTLGGERFSLEERIRPALVAVAFALVSYCLYAMAGFMGYGGEVVRQGSENVLFAPLISLVSAIICMIIWFLKPGRIFGLQLTKGQNNGEEEKKSNQG